VGFVSLSEPSSSPVMGNRVMGRLWAAFFLVGMVPGCWIPSLSNMLKAAEMGEWVPMAFLVGPLAAILSPLWGGALADNRVQAQKLLGWILLGGAAVMWFGFYAVDVGWPPWVFIGLLAMSSLISAPIWSLMTTVCMAHLPSPERQFPLVRVGGTVGWIAGGLLVSLVLEADASPVAGYTAVVLRLLAGVVCFLLPATPPRGTARSWRSLLGLEALRLMRHRDHCVFFLTSMLISIPMMAFYMYTPVHLVVLGDERATGTMAVAQLSEIAAMLVIGSVMVRARVKTVLALALGLTALRFGICAVADLVGGWPVLVAGLALHGVCYTFFFITAQIFLERRVDSMFRGQAQALLAFFTAGIGAVVGAVFVGWVYGMTVDREIIHAWFWFWAVLSVLVGMITVFFLMFYRGSLAVPEKGPIPAMPR